jgi:hypothetical protein
MPNPGHFCSPPHGPLGLTPKQASPHSFAQPRKHDA